MGNIAGFAVSILFLMTGLGLSYSNDPNLLRYNIFVLQSSNVVLECNHEANKGNKWEHEGKPLYVGRNQLSPHLNKTTSLLPNYSLVIDHVTLFHEGLYKCIRDSKTAMEYNLTVEVIPTIYITINGTKDVTDKIFYEESIVIARCYVLGAKPEITLKWVVNKSEMTPSSAECKRNNNKTYDCEATLVTKVRNTKGNITCMGSGLTSFGPLYTSVNLSLSKKRQSSSSKWPLILMAIVPFVCAIGIVVYFLSTQRTVWSQGNAIQSYCSEK
ncbi:hypothetical protein HOLleu_32836 [Holothuria leucospilota]|uniref:Ig-like domain-containing protein n=1 Tax=Holothuria leucospilota TaxID=206669 RepID=A0A9Q1BJ83_HOLLE|nr:hypothetical protein HOLleu_32836 [Holothuria leucospilota]